VCAGDDARTPCPKQGCVPREDSTYITPVHTYVDFLKSLKRDPGMVVVAGIVGGSASVVVEEDPSGSLRLADACDSRLGQASPAVRLNAFVDAFTNRSQAASICSARHAGPLLDVAYRIRDTATRAPCLRGELLDMAPSPGVQPRCRVYDDLAATDSGVDRMDIPPCEVASDYADACYKIVTDDAACGHTPTALAVSVQRRAPAPADAHLVVECMTP